MDHWSMFYRVPFAIYSVFFTVHPALFTTRRIFFDFADTNPDL